MLIATAKKAVVAEAGGGALLWGFPQPEPSLVQELCHIYPCLGRWVNCTNLAGYLLLLKGTWSVRE